MFVFVVETSTTTICTDLSMWPLRQLVLNSALLRWY